METIEKFAKKCDCCGKGMNLGYVDCESTYCSDRCLVWGNSPHSTLNTDEFIPYHPSEWASDHEIFPNSCYYTEWEELEEDEYYLADGTIVTTDEQVNKFKKLNKLDMEIIIGEPQIKESKRLLKQLGANMSNLKDDGVKEVYVTNVTIEYGRGYGQYYKRIDLIIDGSEELTIKKHTTDSITYDELHNTYSDNVISNILKRILIELTEDVQV